ncbi:MAG: LemA family protein [Ilumatobacteraceae bacterium]
MTRGAVAPGGWVDSTIGSPVPAAGGAIGGLALVLLVLAWWTARRRSRLVDVPRSRCAAMFVGFNQLEGTVKAVHETSSYFTGTPAAWWRATLEVERRYQRIETTTDAKGNTTSRVVTEDRFEIEDTWQSGTMIRVADETGDAAVDVEKAQVDVDADYRVVKGDMAGLLGAVLGSSSIGTGPASGVPTGRIRETEWRLADGDRVLCVGHAQIDATGAGVVMSGGGDAEFLVTTKSKGRVADGRRAALWALVVLGVASAAAAAYLAGLPVGGVVAVVAGVMVVTTVAGTVMLYNRLLRVRGYQERAWSLIDVQLSRRAALVPQLVGAAVGYAEHERLTQSEIAAMRSTDVAGVSALAERYPQLAADSVFAALFDELTDTETRIAAAREYFNDSVTVLRDRLHTFPGVLLVAVARGGRFGSRDLLVAGAERETVRVVADSRGLTTA